MLQMLPVEFVLEGPPVSYQSHNRERLREWQERVQEAAREVWQGEPVSIPVQVTIVYFFGDDPVRLDGDNLAKQILDALNQIVYSDDRWVTDIIIRRRDKRWVFQVSPVSALLLTALQQTTDCIYVGVEGVSR